MGLDLEKETGDIKDLIPNKFNDKIEPTFTGLGADYSEQSTNTRNSNHEIFIKGFDMVKDQISSDTDQNFCNEPPLIISKSNSENLPHLLNTSK